MLQVEALKSAYGRIEVLHGVSIEVSEGEIVSLIGANGAGKTTLLRTISGVQPVSGGRILFDGRPIERLAPHRRVAFGIAQVPEGRQLFLPISVEDNLKLGAWTRRNVDFRAELEPIYEMFPMLHQLRDVAAGALSGGQQQMLAIGRALMARPKLLLLDEPSMGLAPILVDQILGVVEGLKRTGPTVLLVEQNAGAALSIADRAYVIETGRVVISGSAATLLADARVQTAYLGV